MRVELQKDFQKYPKRLNTLFFELFEWLDSYGLEKKRSSKRDGSPGNTVEFILNDQQMCSVQISPAGDLHFHFGINVFKGAGLFDKLEDIFDQIKPYIVGDAKGVAKERTSGLKLILTESDADIANIFIAKLKPLFENVVRHYA